MTSTYLLAAVLAALPLAAGGSGPAGGALVIHADPDDGKTDPAGISGARIVCGVIEKR